MSDRQRIWAVVSLVAVTGVWGAAFVLMKDALERQPVNDFLSTRFAIATLILIAIRPKVLKEINLKMLKVALPLGSLLGVGYITQSTGLTHSTAAITGFVTGLYVIFTPILSAIFLKKIITKVEWAAVFVATFGLGLLSLRGWAIGFGEFLTLLCALFFALHIIGLGEWSSKFATYPLTVLQLATVSIITGIAGVSNGYIPPPDYEVWKAIFITAFFATSAGFLIQTWAQAHMDATTVAVILTLEVVFAALVAVIAGQEVLTFRTIAGGVLIVIAMIAMQVKPKYYLSTGSHKLQESEVTP